MCSTRTRSSIEENLPTGRSVWCNQLHSRETKQNGSSAALTWSPCLRETREDDKSNGPDPVFAFNMRIKGSNDNDIFHLSGRVQSARRGRLRVLRLHREQEDRRPIRQGGALTGSPRLA